MTYKFIFSSGQGCAQYAACSKCDGSDYACTNGTGNNEQTYTDIGKGTYLGLTATLYRDGSSPVILYLNDDLQGEFPANTNSGSGGANSVANYPSDTCATQDLVPALAQTGYAVSASNRFVLDDVSGTVSCFTALSLTVAYTGACG